MFNTKNAPEFPSDEVAIGNVYLSKNSAVTKYWVVVGIRERTIILIGLDVEGRITSAQNYGQHVFEDSSWCRGRKPVGRVVNMPDMNLTIEWITLP